MFNLPKLIYFKYVFFLSLCIVTRPSCVHAEDLSLQYEQLIQNENILSSDDIQKLQHFHFLFARGFLDENKRVKTFPDQIALLQKNNISYSILPLESELNEEENAQIISGEIGIRHTITKKPLIIISHSRAGNIVLRALLKKELLQSYVGGWLSVQSPFEGVTVADTIVESKVKRAIAALYLSLLGVSMDIVQEFTRFFREQFLYANAKKITKLLTTVPVLTYGSEIKRLHPSDPNYYLHPTRGPLFIDGTDGLVDFSSTFLSDGNGLVADFVSEFGVDHLGLVLNRNSTRDQRIRKTEALLHLLSSRVKHYSWE